MAKEPYTEQPNVTNAGQNDALLVEATRLIERLNDRARATPLAPELEGEALEALRSFQRTAERLQVLKPE